jgi:hypothetical protein
VYNYTPRPDSHEVELRSADLYSKWGFADGDLMMDLMFEEVRDYHDALVAVVERLLLPKLHQKVVLFTMETSHNPVRAQRVDGVEVEWNGGMGSGPPLSPAVVRVTLGEMRAAAARC